MIVHFYRLERREAGAACLLDCELSIGSWQPDRDGPPSKGSRRLVNYVWWALALAGAFSRPAFSELRIERAGRVVQRLIVTPRWYRFPFMAPEDLQIGNVWTSPDSRRQKLARTALAEAHRRFASDGSTIWYLVDDGNEASAALARSCGYRHVAVGRRTRRFGTSLLGKYVIDRFA
jgi:RimJ/RimL family protein N-acetyltransferase